MNITQIEKRVISLMKEVDKTNFIYDLLAAYNTPKSNIKRLKDGNLNLSKIEGEVYWKKTLFYKSFENQLLSEDDLDEVMANVIKNSKHEQRFIIITNFERFLAFDTKTLDRLDIDISDLGKNYTFFLPWAGMEKAQHLGENPADVKAAERMAKLFDELKKDNPENTSEGIHHLNVFLSRLLFCLFAEDTKIFKDNLFSNSIDSYTAKDGNDTDTYLSRIFEVLNLPEGQEREALPEHLIKFPYVNGGLFADKIKVPKFSKKSRQILIDAGAILDWKDINPDIFGSMFQAVIGEEQRGTLGQHYTSVPNIMKVVQPLFLDELYEAFEEAKDNAKKLQDLLKRLGKIKIFDPACGSGNFLIIAYKELRKLEILILKTKAELEGNAGLGNINFGGEFSSQISLSQFYGIEIDDFAHEIAILALWLAEHQMNVVFFNTFGQTNPTLPLRAAGHIAHGNACRLDWELVCPKKENDEIYILGNPPYLGARIQDKSQKEDLSLVFRGNEVYKDSDYIVCWFLKSAEYIQGINSKYAFVSTNSVNQGEQVAYYWPTIFNLGLEIEFAYPSFKWENSAKGNAGVIVVIIGVRNISKKVKAIYNGDIKLNCKNISPYLTNSNNVFVYSRKTPLCNFPKMVLGSMARDGGHLILSTEEKNKIINQEKISVEIIKRLYGSAEFINDRERWCLWIKDNNIEEVLNYPEIKRRINLVKEFRLASKAKTTNGYSSIPHKFAQRSHIESNSIIMPRVSSERRNYIPCGFLDSNSIISDSALGIYSAEIWLLSILTSCMHMTWVRTVSGRLKSDYRYSSALSYNTFPFPNVSDDVKQQLEQSVKNILTERAKHSDLTLAQMYDPDKMPNGLREEHHQNDLLIDSCYREEPFESDEERLEHLFKLYEKMIAKEQRQLEKEKAKKKTKRTVKKK